MGEGLAQVNLTCLYSRMSINLQLHHSMLFTAMIQKQVRIYQSTDRLCTQVHKSDSIGHILYVCVCESIKFSRG